MTTTNFRAAESAYAAVAKLVDDEHRPYSAMIEVADRCNEVCVHCYQVQGQKGEMTTEQLFRVMDELAEMGVLFLTLSGGEPTLRSDFLELVEHARRRQFAVKIYTNGLRIDDAMADRLAELAVQEVQISLYSPRAEVHDLVTRVPGSHERSIAAARRLITRGVRVVIKSPIMKINADERREYVALVEELGAHYMLDGHVDAREDGSRDPEVLAVDHRRGVELRRDPLLYEPQPREDSMRDPAIDRAPCGACSGHVHIEANGELQPCTLMSVPVGNALADGVAGAWEKNANGRLLRGLTYRDIHGCRVCALQPYCHRCYANALIQGGDALGPYAEACEHARVEYELARGAAPVIEGDAPVGPYGHLGDHRFEPIADDLDATDEERYRRFPWLRRGASPRPPEPSGELVQIRRPGAREPETLRISGAPAGAGAREAE